MDKYLGAVVRTIRRSDFVTSILMLCIVIVVTGPFGTFLEVPFAVRAVYMPFLIIVGAFALAGTEAFVDQFAPKVHILIKGFSVGAIMAVFFSPVVLVVADMATVGFREPREMPHVVQIVFGLTLFFYLIRHVFVREVGVTADAPKDRLRELLELSPDAELLAVSADDHYVRVLTDQGEHRVLLRFSDALRELDALDGAQVHRSHWVAKISATELNRDGQRHHVRLSNGVLIPVSRGKLDATRQMLQAA